MTPLLSDRASFQSQSAPPYGPSHLAGAGDPQSPGSETEAGEDRRRYPRITGCYPAILRSIMADGQRRQQLAVLDSVSKGGLFLVTQANLEIGASILVVFKLSATSMGDGPRVAVRGRVQRVVPQYGGTFGVAVIFQRHRFLYSDPGHASVAVYTSTPIKMLST